MTIQVASGGRHAMLMDVQSILFITDPYIEHLLEGVVRIGICFLPPGTISSAWTRER